MRITQTMMTRNYLYALNNVSTAYDKTFNKVASGRSFEKMSENVTAGTRALKIRTSLYRNEQYQENTDSASASLRIAEDNLTSTEDLMVNAHQLALRIQNGTFDQNQRDVMATEFKTQMGQILKNGNAIYGDSYVFSGTKADDVPFTTGDYTAINTEPYYNESRITDINKVVNFAEYFDVSKIPGLAEEYPDSLRNQTTYVGTWNEDGTIFTFKGDNGRMMSLEGNLDTGYDFYDSLDTISGTRNSVDLSEYSNFIKKIPVSTSFAAQSDPAEYTYYDKALKTNVTQKLLDENGNEWNRDSDGMYRTSEMTVEYDENGNCIKYDGLTDAQIRNKTVYYDEDHGNVTESTGYFQTVGDAFQGNYVRNNKTGFFYELNRDDGGKTYTNEYGDRIKVGEDEPRYAVQKVQYSEPNFVDIGLGLKVSDSYGVDSNSVVKSNVSGLDSFGFGTTDVSYTLKDSVKDVPYEDRSMFRKLFDAKGDGDGKVTFEIANNAYTLFETAAKALEQSIIPDSMRSAYKTLPPDSQGRDQRELIQQALRNEIDPEQQLSKEKIYSGTFIDDAGREVTFDYSAYDMYKCIGDYNETILSAVDEHIVAKTQDVVLQITDIGIRGAALKTNSERLENEELTLKELQIATELLDENKLAEEASNLSMNEYAWTLTLQFGNKFLPLTLMDYIS
jgi:flagellin-like hook-associated protein FlgL